MNIAIITLSITFVLCVVIIIAARISKAKRDKAARKEAAEKLANTRASIALQRFKLSGIERRMKWTEEDSELK